MEKQHSVQFFNSFVESIQSLCQKHLFFDQFVEVGGYLTVEIDNTKKERYVLSEIMQNGGSVVSESFCVEGFRASDSKLSSNSNWAKQSITRRGDNSEDFRGSGYKYRKLHEHGQHSETLQSHEERDVPGSPDRNPYYQLEPLDQDTLHPSSDNCPGTTESESLRTKSTTSDKDEYIQGNVQTEVPFEQSSTNQFSGQSDMHETRVTATSAQPGDEISGDVDALIDDDNVIDVDLLDDDLDPDPDPSPGVGAPDTDLFTHRDLYRDCTTLNMSQGPSTAGAGVEHTNRYPSGQRKKILSPGTIYTIRSSVNMFKKYHLRKSGVNLDLFMTPPEKMNELLLEYLQGARKINGEKPSIRSLKSVQERLDMFLTGGGYPYSLRKGVQFATSISYIQQIMGEQVKLATPMYSHVDDDDVEKLFNFNQIGHQNPETLTNGMWFLNCRFFAVRRPNEHLMLKWKDIGLRVDEHGQEYIAKPIGDSMCLKKFANVQNPDQCFVRLYKTFRDARPAGMCCDESPFYLKQNRHLQHPDQCWYSLQPMSWSSFSNIWRKMVFGAFLPINKRIF